MAPRESEEAGAHAHAWSSSPAAPEPSVGTECSPTATPHPTLPPFLTQATSLTPWSVSRSSCCNQALGRQVQALLPDSEASAAHPPSTELQLEAAVQPTGHQLRKEPVPYLCKPLKHHISGAFVPSVCPSTASGRLLDACGWTASPPSAIIPPANSPMGRPALSVEEEILPRGLKSPP